MCKIASNMNYSTLSHFLLWKQLLFKPLITLEFSEGIAGFNRMMEVWQSETAKRRTWTLFKNKNTFNKDILKLLSYIQFDAQL